MRGWFLIFLFFAETGLFSLESFGDRHEFNLNAGSYFAEPSENENIQDLKEEGSEPLVKMQATNDQGVATVVIDFPEPVTFREKMEGQTFYVQFNQSIDSKDLIDLQDQIGPMAERISNGYNSLYIVASRSVFFTVEKTSNYSVAIRIVPNSWSHLNVTKKVKLAFARLLVEEYHFESALTYLECLLDEYPEDEDVLLLLSTLEGLMPRWINQVEVLEVVAQEHPYDEDVEILLMEAYTPHSTFIEVERQMQRTENLAAVQLYGVRGELVVNSSPNSIFYVGGNYQLWSGHVGEVTECNNTTDGFRGRRGQGSLYVRKDWKKARTLKLSLYDQRSVFGAGAEFGCLVPKIQGVFNASLDWNKPTWEVFECLAFNGREQRFYARIDALWDRYISWGIGGGMRRVGNSCAPNGYTSALLSTQLNVAFIQANPVAGINYSIDAEYVVGRQYKKDAAGVRFLPVDYTSFENHTIKGYFIYIYRDWWYFSGYGGETFNRIGLNAPTFGGEIRYAKPLPCSWEFRVAFDQFPSTIITGATAQYLTATVTVRF